jgi:hypothetical protein
MYDDYDPTITSLARSLGKSIQISQNLNKKKQ